MAMVQFLGPQRFHPTVSAAVEAAGVSGSLAVVTAGWQERETEVEELEEHLGARTTNLALYRRHEEILRADRELARALRKKHELLRELQELYRIRLAHVKASLRALLAREGTETIVRPARDEAFAALRALDQHHLARIGEIHAEFEARFRPSDRAVVAFHRRELAAALADTGALLVAGGHVAVLLNRMRLIDLPSLVHGKAIIAWSAGAMALSDRVVLFHDDPPQGSGDAEILDFGLGLGPGVVVFPHARRRLHLDDRVRVTMLARRFEPALCVPLDDGARLTRNGSSWSAAAGTGRLDARGEWVAMASPMGGR